MDLKKARILLKKINYLFDVMNADPDNIVRIERDMMHTYIRDLYEVFFDGIVLEKSGRAYKKEETEIAGTEAIAKVSKSNRDEVVKPPKKKYAPPREIILPASLKEEGKVEKKVPLKKKPDPVAAKVEIKAPPPPIVKTAKSVTPSQEVKELFRFPKSRELSDKLSSLPIASLAKGISINERILAINELFAGDTKAYNDAIKRLDSLSNFEEATNWLAENIIPKYDWVNAKKSKKAKVFIKLVKRRYN